LRVLPYAAMSPYPKSSARITTKFGVDCSGAGEHAADQAKTARQAKHDGFMAHSLPRILVRSTMWCENLWTHPN